MHRHLLNALVLVMDQIRQPEALRPMLEQLGKRHVGYGVFPSHFYAVSSCLIDVMRSYQQSQNLTKTDHDLKRRAIRDIAAVS